MTMLRDLTTEQAERAANRKALKEDPCAGWPAAFNDPLLCQLGSLLHGGPLYREIVPITSPFTTLPQFDALRGQDTYRTQEYRLLDGQVLRREVVFERPPAGRFSLWEETETGEWRVFDSALDGYIELFEAMLPDFRHMLHWVKDEWENRAALASIERAQQIVEMLRALRQQDRIRQFQRALDALTSTECERAIFSKLWHFGVRRDLAEICATKVRELLADRANRAIKE
jgi:hypothetical protein